MGLADRHVNPSRRLWMTGHLSVAIVALADNEEVFADHAGVIRSRGHLDLNGLGDVHGRRRCLRRGDPVWVLATVQAWESPPIAALPDLLKKPRKKGDMWAA